MPSGYPFPLETRRAFFNLVCSGTPIRTAAKLTGVSETRAFQWWADAEPMTTTRGPRSSWATFSCRPDQPGGRGHRLNLVERIAIMRGRDAKASYGAIARSIDRDKAVVYREVQRNSNSDGSYHALLADSRAAERAQRPKEFKLTASPQLCAMIETWMDQGWSPKLIADVLRRDHPGDKATGEPRDHLPMPVCPSQRRFADRSVPAAVDPAGCPKASRQRHPAGTLLRRGFQDLGPASRGRGPRGARPLGRRPADGGHG